MTTINQHKLVIYITYIIYLLRVLLIVDKNKLKMAFPFHERHQGKRERKKTAVDRPTSASTVRHDNYQVGGALGTSSTHFLRHTAGPGNGPGAVFPYGLYEHGMCGLKG